MSNLTLKFESKELNQYLDKLVRNFPVELADATRKTAIETMQIARKELPIRTGILRRSAIAQRKSNFEYLIWHGRSLKSGKVKYADTIEAGRRSLTIKPKRAKSLMFGTKKSSVTKSGHIRAGVKRRFFADLNNPDIKLTKKQLQVKYGVVLLKPGQSITQKPRKGQWNYRDKIQPKSENAFKRHLFKKFRKLGFN